MTLKKMVNGVVMDMTPEEEADHLASLNYFNRQDAALQIDGAVAEIYARYTRFQMEYEEREQQALQYQSANYEGTVPIQVGAYAQAAGKTPQEATLLILGQAAQLRGALSQLGVLRMRKNYVLRLPEEEARTEYSTTLTQIKAIGDALT